MFSLFIPKQILQIWPVVYALSLTYHSQAVEQQKRLRLIQEYMLLFITGPSALKEIAIT
jgi:hypothetical protein